MQLASRYYKFSKISEVKSCYLLRPFAMYLMASDAAQLAGPSIRAVSVAYPLLRHRFLAWSLMPAELNGAVELDESYFGPQRVCGKGGRGPGAGAIVFDLFKSRCQVTPKSFP